MERNAFIKEKTKNDLVDYLRLRVISILTEELNFEKKKVERIYQKQNGQIPRVVESLLGFTLPPINQKESSFSGPKIIRGRKVVVKLDEIKPFKFLGKLDTGAFVSSISAINIKRFSKGKEKQEYVEFEICHPSMWKNKGKRKKKRKGKVMRSLRNQGKPFSIKVIKKIKRIAKVKNTSGIAIPRIVVEFSCEINKQIKTIEVNLMDRRELKHCILIGIKAIRTFNFAIAPSRRSKFSQSFSYSKKGRNE